MDPLCILSVQSTKGVLTSPHNILTLDDSKQLLVDGFAEVVQCEQNGTLLISKESVRNQIPPKNDANTCTVAHSENTSDFIVEEAPHSSNQLPLCTLQNLSSIGQSLAELTVHRDIVHVNCPKCTPDGCDVSFKTHLPGCLILPAIATQCFSPDGHSGHSRRVVAVARKGTPKCYIFVIANQDAASGRLVEPVETIDCGAGIYGIAVKYLSLKDSNACYMALITATCHRNAGDLFSNTSSNCSLNLLSYCLPITLSSRHPQVKPANMSTAVTAVASTPNSANQPPQCVFLMMVRLCNNIVDKIGMSVKRGETEIAGMLHQTLTDVLQYLLQNNSDING